MHCMHGLAKAYLVFLFFPTFLEFTDSGPTLSFSLLQGIFLLRLCC